MRVLKASNVISGLTMVGIGLLLRSQTDGFGGMEVGGYGPMVYPVTLIYIFIALGVLIMFSPAESTKAPATQQIPIFSRRTCLIGLIILLYSIGFTFIGFITASYLASVACALVMGWKRVPFLLIINFVVVLGIWLIARYVLKMPLPEGILI